MTERRILESTRTKAIIKHINSLPGFFVVKRHSTGANRNGDPDITGCGPGGKRIEIEVKQPGKKPTTLQFARLQQWSEAGAWTGWATDVEGAKQLIEGWLNEQNSVC